MINVLYLGNDLRVNTLLENKGIHIEFLSSGKYHCMFSEKKIDLILIDETLYSNYINSFPCLFYYKNIIVLQEKEDNSLISNFNNIINFYSYRYFLENLELILKYYIYKFGELKNNIKYVHNYQQLEEKIQEKKVLANIHLFDLGYYYKNYGYVFLKKVLNLFLDTLSSIIPDDLEMYVLGQSDFFITGNTSMQNLENISKNIINSFKFNSFSIDKIDIKFKFKIAASYDEHSLSLISKTLNNINNMKEYNQLNVNYKDSMFIEQQNNFLLARKINQSFIDMNLITYYQPIIENVNYEIEMYECLIRHKDSELSPGEFIPVLQKARLTSLIAYTIIEQAFKKLNGTKHKISINICQEDLENQKLIAFIKEQQKKNGIASNRIVFEVVESFSSANNDFIISQLKTLKENGYLIALDDFGMNDSNFSVLFELEIDYIKIDGKFISKLKEKKYYKIVKALVAMAHALDVKVVAEFVDNEEIQNIVRKLEIDYSQGYFIGKPSEDI